MWSSLRPCFLKIIKDLRKQSLFLKFLLFFESYFKMKKREYLSNSHKNVFSYFTFIIQIKCDKCLTTALTEPNSIYELLPTKASWQHGLLLKISSVSGELLMHLFYIKGSENTQF